MWTVIAMFVVTLSGLTALIHQFVWDRLLRLHFGADDIATTLVTATFIFGLGLGAVLFGRQWRRPFFVYGLLEVGIGIFAILSFPFVS